MSASILPFPSSELFPPASHLAHNSSAPVQLVPDGVSPTILPEITETGPYVDEVFEAVVELEGEAQDERLADLCVGHPSVAGEVRELLAFTGATEPTELGAPEPKAGVRAGRYELQRTLGSGASASVWQAWDHKLQTPVALKILHNEISKKLESKRALEAVLGEARAASAITSDHVVRIKEAGRTPQGWPFIAMELCAEHRPSIEGGQELDLGSSLCDVQLTDDNEVVRIIAQAARGVAAAHLAGVLHRDIKPANILLLPVSRTARVTDFGLAVESLHPPITPQTSPLSTCTLLTDAPDGRLVGTPSYMPPEQAFGHPATRAADVYALGASLYALLCGHAPFEPEPDCPVPALDVIRQVQEERPTPIKVFRPDLDKRLRRIINKAMMRSPSQRYHTADAMAEDLELWLADQRTSEDGRITGVGLWVRRNRGAVMTASMLLCMLGIVLTATAGLAFQSYHLQQQMTTAQTKLAHTLKRTEAAEAAAEEAKATRMTALREAGEARKRTSAALASEDAALGMAAAERRRRAAALGIVQVEQKRSARAQTERERAEEVATAAVLAMKEEADLRAEAARESTRTLQVMTTQLQELSDERALWESERNRWEIERNALIREIANLHLTISQQTPPPADLKVTNP